MNSARPLKALVVHPQFTRPGGAELVSLRFIERMITNLQAHVTLLCLKDFDVENLQKKTGIYFPTRNLDILIANQPFWLKHIEPSLFQLRLAFLHRVAKHISKEYDLCIGTRNEIDFGRKGIQYINHPNFANWRFLDSFEMAGDSIIKKIPVLENIYRLLVRKISKDTIHGFKKNVTLTNSKFMAEKIAHLYGLYPIVVYPSVSAENIAQPYELWNRRKLRFVTVGRIASDKNLIGYVDFCRTIARKLPDAEFMIIGRIDQPAYYRYLLRYIKKVAVPVQIRTEVDTQEINMLLRESKFFIATKRYEHFGIAILEAANAGCITFVHDTGGQVEIISPSILRYQTLKDLLEKINYLLNNSEVLEKTLENMKVGLRPFTLQRFYAEIDAAMNGFLSARTEK